MVRRRPRQPWPRVDHPEDGPAAGARGSQEACPGRVRETSARHMKYAEPRPYADPEKAARRIVEIASTVEPVQDGRIHIELINQPFLFTDKASPDEYGSGLKLAIDRGWLLIHECCTFMH